MRTPWPQWGLFMVCEDLITLFGYERIALREPQVYEIFPDLLLQHQPLGMDVVSRMPPVTLRIKIIEM
jgi:hypothetical protein